jgi:hypothetical protein
MSMSQNEFTAYLSLNQAVKGQVMGPKIKKGYRLINNLLEDASVLGPLRCVLRVKHQAARHERLEASC